LQQPGEAEAFFRLKRLAKMDDTGGMRRVNHIRTFIHERFLPAFWLHLQAELLVMKKEWRYD
jgi:hypothetical protein